MRHRWLHYGQEERRKRLEYRGFIRVKKREAKRLARREGKAAARLDD